MGGWETLDTTESKTRSSYNAPGARCGSAILSRRSYRQMMQGLLSDSETRLGGIIPTGFCALIRRVELKPDFEARGV